MVLDWTLLLKPKEGRRGKELDESARGSLDRQSAATGSCLIWPWIKKMCQRLGRGSDTGPFEEV
jgi:hypothetical protein